MRRTIPLIGVLILLLALPTVQAAGTVTKIHVQEDGDATWTVEIRQTLETQSAEDAFLALSDRIETANATTSFRDRLHTTVQKAGERTGREMSVTDFQASAEVQGLSTKQGVVRYTFEWTGFAHGSGDALLLGDAIEGYYVSDGDLLEIRLPENTSAATVEPAPDRENGRYLSWTGPQSFGPGEPVIETSLVSPDGDAGTTGTDSVGGTEPYSAHDTGGVNIPAATFVSLLGLLLAGFLFHRLNATPTAILDVREETWTETEAPVPDGEQVLNILRKNEGRVRQADIAGETGWSEAKVSNVTNRLKREGTIEKQRWGRENILLLAQSEEECKEGLI